MFVYYLCGWLIPNSNEDNDADESVLWLLLCFDVTRSSRMANRMYTLNLGAVLIPVSM